MEKIIRGQNVNPKKLQRAKELRRNMTAAEEILWDRLRKNQLGGFHFRRQQVIYGFIADFYCNVADLVIEVDGGIHKELLEYDRERDRLFISKGLRVIRITNREIEERLESTLQKILDSCNQS